MTELKDLHEGARVRGILPNTTVTVVSVQWFNTTTVNLTYRVEETGQVANRLVFDWQASSFDIEAPGSAWAFDGDGDKFRLALEAFRIKLAFLFDPYLGVTVSRVEPLPHQIQVVYEAMLKRNPLRFLLADDPGAGKTIMAGLLIKELMLRGLLERCLIVVPANLADQWQDELVQKFDLPFHILGRHEIEQAAGNPFEEHNLVISRIDLLKQEENVERLRHSDWDLVVVDEAHKMSATYDTAGDRRETARYKLGKVLGDKTRHYLLMTATPHRGKEADFQLFLALLDADRFEGRYRDGIHRSDPSDLMARRLKEDLLDFDGHPLFPPRRADTVKYELSDAEMDLYERVTAYVRDQMGRADAAVRAAEEAAQTGASGDAKKRRAVVGFALTVLQRRLASSPYAIYQSLSRRRRRLERTYDERRQQRDNAERLVLAGDVALATARVDDLEDDLTERPEDEIEHIVDAASAATTLRELRQEIDVLRDLEAQAKQVTDTQPDTKWLKLKDLLHNRAEMFDQQGRRLKLVIFTEHKDTLDYLVHDLRDLLRNPDAVVAIHGSLHRDHRRAAQEEFVNNPDVLILVATDAAGEGINLQNAHLMVNYDLPWNPNRLEQRFGRIHRFGQRDMCFVWNLVAAKTREGQVFDTLFAKLEEMREALGGRVFDVLGRLFEGNDLRELMLDAILENESDIARAYMQQRLEQVISRDHIERVLQEEALNVTTFGPGIVDTLREQMQRAEVNRLVPYYIAAFFKAGFADIGGSLLDREADRYEVSHVPAELRRRAQLRGRALSRRYDRVCFDKSRLHVDRKPPAEFVAPGHPLLDGAIDILLERYEAFLRRGAILVDDSEDAPPVPRAMFAVRLDITDARPTPSGAQRLVSSQLHFVELQADGLAIKTQPGPYLSYRSPHPWQVDAARALGGDWVNRHVEDRARDYAVTHLVEPHFRDVSATRLALINKTRNAVQDRLQKEIAFWDGEAERLKDLELAGRQPRRNSAYAAERRDQLADRLQRRMTELDQEAVLAPQPPILVAGALVIPAHLLPPPPRRGSGFDRSTLDAPRAPAVALDPAARRRVEALAMQAVLAEETRRGGAPQDVSALNRGYDIEAHDPDTGRLRFIEVKGRVEGADAVTITRNEWFQGLNVPHDYILAVALVDLDAERVVRLDYYRHPFTAIADDPTGPLSAVNLHLGRLADHPGRESIQP